jgi:TonB family protein
VFLPLAFVVILGQARAADVAPSDLAAAKALYASASYEEALSRLSTVRNPDDVDQVEQYRALCLLALGRGPEAERTLERIVTRRPLYVATDADVSPRLVSMLHDVRKRLLPGAARTVYTKAKTDFDAKNYETASAGFTELLAILADPDTAEASAGLSDLKMLGEGFLKLANAELTAKSQAEAPAAVKTPAAPAAPAGPAIYSADDTGVVAPTDIEKALPPWEPKDPAIARLTFRGTLEIVIDPQGNVESATMRKSVIAPYDAALLEAAKHWRFNPAKRNGEAVRFRRFIDIVLTPHGATIPDWP